MRCLFAPSFQDGSGSVPDGAGAIGAQADSAMDAATAASQRRRVSEKSEVAIDMGFLLG